MIYRLSNNVEHILLDEGSVIFDPGTGDTHVLDETGGDVLKLCNGKNTVEDIAEELSRIYDAPVTDIMKDVAGYLEELYEKGVLVREG